MELIGFAVVFLVLLNSACVTGQGRWGGMGPGMMMQSGMMDNQGGMMGGPGTERTYMQTFHALLDAHKEMKRKVAPTATGVATETWSDNPEIAKLIQKHVAEMIQLMDGCAKGSCPAQPRWWDPLFTAAYSLASKIHIQMTPTAQGVKVVESGSDNYAKQLVQAHAAVVSKFVQNGMAEMHAVHPAPKATLS